MKKKKINNSNLEMKNKIRIKNKLKNRIKK